MDTESVHSVEVLVENGVLHGGHCGKRLNDYRGPGQCRQVHWADIGTWPWASAEWQCDKIWNHTLRSPPAIDSLATATRKPIWESGSFGRYTVLPAV